jgi:hypothetical protein
MLGFKNITRSEKPWYGVKAVSFRNWYVICLDCHETEEKTMKKGKIMLLCVLLLEGFTWGLWAGIPEFSRPLPPLRVSGDVRLCVSRDPGSVVPHFMVANLVVTRGGTGVNGLDITIGPVRMIQGAYGLPGHYHSESNQYLAVGGADLTLTIKPGKALPGSKAPLDLVKKTGITASARIGSLITITGPAEGVVSFPPPPAGGPPLGIKQVVGFTWIGGESPFALSLLRNPATSPLNFYTREGLMNRSHAVPLGQFTPGQPCAVHVSCAYPAFKFRPDVLVDPSSGVTLSFAAMKNFVVNIGG